MKRYLSVFTLMAGIFLIAGMSSCKSSSSGSDKATTEKSATAALTPEDLGWKLAIQCWTFNKYTFAEALEKMKELGVKYVEAYPGQKIGGGYEGTTMFTNSEQERQAMKDLLKKNGLTLINYGVVTPKTKEDWIKLFEFAKEMGIETINSEPHPDQMDLVDSLANAYGINIGIHDHPKPSFYWNPDTLLYYIKGHSDRIGACADVGHWVRSGLDPVECLKKLDGHIKSLHFKELNEKSRDAHDVPWGTGISDVPAMLQVLKDQGFKGVFSVEYEYHWKSSMPEIKESLENFRKIVSQLK
jgi:sugar phosphate isomerase/epimerase